MLSSSWGLVFGAPTFKICPGDLDNSCFCDQDDDASASMAGSGLWNDSSVLVSFDLVLVSSSSKENSGAHQQFVVILSWWYPAFLHLQYRSFCSVQWYSVFVTSCIRVLKVSSHLAHSVILFLWSLSLGVLLFDPCLWALCSVIPVFGCSVSLIPVLGLLLCHPSSGLGQSIPWF